MRRLALAIVVTLALSGAAVLDRFAPASIPLPLVDHSATAGGVWACPVVNFPANGGWLHLANAGSAASRVRVTYVAEGVKPVEQAVALQAGQAKTVSPPATIGNRGVGAIVEYAGGDVVVSRTMILPDQGKAGVGAAPCARPGAAVLVAPQGQTIPGDTQIAMLNPGSSDALVDIALLFRGQRLTPESLSRRIVPARGRLVIREGDFAFNEPNVAALIVARSGRVVADAVMLAPTARLFDIAPAQAASRELVTVGSTALGSVRFSMVTAADENAVTSGRLISGAEQTTYETLTAGLQPDTPRAGGVPGTDVPPGAVALAVESRTGQIAIGARWLIRAGRGAVETAASSGVEPSRRAIVVLGRPAQAADMRLLVVNPEQQDTTVSLTLLTASGPAKPPALQGIAVGAGRTTTVALPAQPANATVGVVLESSVARVAAVLEGRAALPGVFAVFAVTATPDVVVPIVAIEPDPLQGVPAQ